MVGQDWAKLAVIFTVLIGMLTTSAQLRGMTAIEKASSGPDKGTFTQVMVPSDPNNPDSPKVAGTRQKTVGDTFLYQMLNPIPKDYKFRERPQMPATAVPGAAPAGGGA